MIQKTVVIKFSSPVHMGERGIGIEEASPYIRSDTLYGAIISTISTFYGEDIADEIVKCFLEGKPPFLVSSLFPVLQEEYMLPIPLSLFKILRETSIDIKAIGILKHIQYVSIDFFKKYVNGSKIGLTIKEETKEKRYLEFNIEGEVYRGVPEGWGYGVIVKKNIIEGKENYISFRKSKFPKNRLDRISLASDIFYVGLIDFNCKHYFILHVEKDYFNTIITAIKMLGYLGLGGERTYGYGRFRVEKILDEPKIPSNENGKYLINLSLYLPSEREIIVIKDRIEDIFYRLHLRVGSYSGTGLARRDIFVFSEGSVLPSNNFNFIGSHILEQDNSGKSIRIYYPIFVKSSR